ncbi:ABC transporter ATP-binding protein [Tenacibaculum sp. SZ-18]|uniref:ABC transporter ATP-binding protein n=1 Tax=Tenacibaculum sp. SZ-18 TaxID=754423 RepID=UPI000C2D4C97|nr:ABC transporter ATP-binding protein [Tenacibaculum sp. SZ-18]AUC16715.1 ABC transporter ATP-binding protein [Tenacibaculum sp. SZ-18]
MLILKDFSVSIKNKPILKKINFTIKNNSILGLVGESGSGKSIMSLSIMGLLSGDNIHFKGTISFQNNNILNFGEADFLKIRGNEISLIFQEPMTSLNPSLTCGYQLFEVFKNHTKLGKTEIEAEIISLFEQVKLPRPKDIYKSYPHQISGGQKQRVMIAMALALKPQLLIADEPTTALDVTVQKEIISLLKTLQKETQMSILFISHDLNLIREIADEVVVLKKGKIIEYNSSEEIFKDPQKDYTKALINSKPNSDNRLKKLPTVEDFLNDSIDLTIKSFEDRARYHKEIYGKPPLIEIKNLHKEFISNSFLFKKPASVKAVNNVSFSIYEGETLGLVGESGCGKTTLGRTILQLEKATSGSVYYKGRDITTLKRRSLKKLRKEIQIIFQDPFSSLNPRIPVGEAIIEPMKVHNILTSYKERKNYVIEVLKKVGLEEEHFNRFPHEFSGGQRQRIGIARTIALQPKFIICDESVSALDVSVQAQVLNLLNDLKKDFGFTYLFISHDLSVVKYMSDNVIVMNKGEITEIGEADELYKNPKNEYTKTLIDAVPKEV